MSATVRPATMSDLKEVAALFNAYRQFYEQPDDPRLARRFIGNRMLNNESVILLAESSDGGSMAHFSLKAGQTAAAVTHRTVEEVWYLLEGCGNPAARSRLRDHAALPCRRERR